MASFIDFAFREEYERVRILGDKLSEIDTLINWEAFRPIVKDLCTIVTLPTAAELRGIPIK